MASSSYQCLPVVEFLIQSAQHLQVAPIVKYSALSLFAHSFLPSLPAFIQGANSANWLLQPVTERTLQLFVLVSLWISSKIHDSQLLSVISLKSLADKSIKEQHLTTRNFLEAEVLFFRGVAKVGDLINFEACMEIMDLLYEKEDTSILYMSPHSLAASILVVSYVMTVPKQKREFPVLAWVNFVTSCKEEDIIKMVKQILKHVLEPS